MDNEQEGFPITALREVKILQLLRHENIVTLYVSCNSVYSSSDIISCYQIVGQQTSNSFPSLYVTVKLFSTGDLQK